MPPLPPRFTTYRWKKWTKVSAGTPKPSILDSSTDERFGLTRATETDVAEAENYIKPTLTISEGESLAG
jgi:hypothetical protein